MKIVIATGGTGGHLFPALKVAEELRLRGVDVIFIGALAMGIEKIKQRGFSYYHIPSRGFQKKNIKDIFSVVISILKAFKISWQILRKINPDKVLGFGGYASFSVMMAAWFLKIPGMLHEQNAIPGRANELLSLFVKKTALSFEDSKKYFNPEKIVITGCPTHITPQGVLKEDAYRFFGFQEHKTTLFVFGGSQGSHRINQVFIEALMLLKQQMTIQVIHVTGVNDFDTIKARYASIDISKAIFPFLDRIDYAYRIADLVVARSGAAAVTEICLFGCPSLFIPFPYAIGDHQRYNAEILTSRRLAHMIEEKDLTALKLQATICDIIKQNISREDLTEKLQTIVFSDAEKRLAEEAINL